MRRLALLASLAVTALILRTGPAVMASEASPVPESAYTTVTGNLIEHHVLPGYRRLADTAAGFADDAMAYCGGKPAAIEAARRSFDATMDAWMRAEHLRFGPIELLMRGYRFHFWPEGRGKLKAALAELLEDGDLEALSAENFPNASIVVQGLPAAELLLFGDEPADPATDLGKRGCAVLVAIAGNLRDMAANVLAAWQDGEQGFARTMTRPGEDNPYYETDRDAILMFFKSLDRALQLIADVKLNPVLGPTIDRARPGYAESQPSGRAMANIAAGLAAAEGLYLGDGGAGFSSLATRYGNDAKLDPLLRKAFGVTRQTAASIALPLEQAVLDPVERAKLETLLAQVRALRQIVRTRLAPAIDIAAGFNALDGD
ncbi:imelysin family protein [Oceanibacterium hippocampi]|uniref:Iron-regulated protein A n=1 Tax=Oceanibacterium hippocampi TaxID=745714 RepID=A0A1Y5TX46_9PROT|nr:imelysin family protein [Oceanibacterium hippocampi]SLN75881.1 Iron-regulated protein A precursor [Oceanibacterium hippocampi]